MTCKEILPELIESARRRGQLHGSLRSHVAGCPECYDRWEAERHLTAHLRMISARTAGMEPPQYVADSLMREFAKRHKRKAVPVWVWQLAAAAAILMAILIGHAAGLRARHTAPPAVRVRTSPWNDAVVYEVSADGASLASDGFVELPYTPPVATGELVRMVHTEMYPEALAGMGVQVDPTWVEGIPVDLVVGEDGLPHAVRISDSTQNE
jgi:hypothetical protein